MQELTLTQTQGGTPPPLETPLSGCQDVSPSQTQMQIHEEESFPVRTRCYDLIIEEHEARQLAEEITQLHILAQEFSQFLQIQGDTINRITENLEETDMQVERGNDQLIGAVKTKGKRTVLKGTAIGLTCGSGVGTAVGIYFAGVGAILGLVLGAICGTLAGGTSSKLIKNKLDTFLHDTIKYNRNRTPSSPNIDSQMQVFSTETSAQDNNFSDVQNNMPISNSCSSMQDTANASIVESHQTEQLLQTSLQKLYQISNLSGVNFDQLVIQGEQLYRSARTVENIQQELETTGILVTRITSNSALYFLKLLFSPQMRRDYIGRLIEHINNQARTVKERERKRNGVLGLGLPVINWQDVACKKDFLLLQRRYLNQYRIVAINPTNRNRVTKIYYFQGKLEDAKNQLEKVKLLFIKMYDQLSVGNIYKILNCLPELDDIVENIHQKENKLTTKNEHFLNEMERVLKDEILPTGKAINEELRLQNGTLDIMQRPIERNKEKISKYSQKLDK